MRSNAIRLESAVIWSLFRDFAEKTVVVRLVEQVDDLTKFNGAPVVGRFTEGAGFRGNPGLCCERAEANSAGFLVQPCSSQLKQMFKQVFLGGFVDSVDDVLQN